MNERKSVRDDMEHGGEPPGSAYRWMWERMMVVMIESSLLFGSIIFQRSREEVKPESVCRGVRLHPRVDTLGRGYYLVWIPPNLSNADGDVTIMECSFQE
jgi:hypothetical protein